MVNRAVIVKRRNGVDFLYVDFLDIPDDGSVMRFSYFELANGGLYSRNGGWIIYMHFRILMMPDF